ncbi:putative endo-beta-1,4-glucanase D, partial [Colletotrichum tanaceti]
NTVDFTLPKDTPNGEYLIRVEHIGVHGAHVGQAEFSILSSAVVNGIPGPTIKFPGGYKKCDPSFNFSIYGGSKAYPMPGPAVWTGGSSNNSGSDSEAEASTTPVSSNNNNAGEEDCKNKKSARRSRIIREQ